MKQSTPVASVITALLLAAALQAHSQDHSQDLKLQTSYSIPGKDGWDYITIDSAARRLYVSHSVRVNVLNADTGAPIGIIEDTPGVHGIAIASEQKHGFTSNGKEDKVSMFDTNTLVLIKKIDVGKGPDGIYFDPRSKRVFTNNHHSHDITAIDAATGGVVGTIPVEGNGEGMVTGKDGLIYVALEDKNEIAVFDPVTFEVKRHLALDGVTAPTGLAIDVRQNRLFIGGHNKTMLVLDAGSGKRIASLPTGSGTDAAGFDPRRHLVFFSNGEGNLTVIQQMSADEYTALAPVATKPSAKTMAFDSKTEKVFLPAAEVITTPASDPSQKPKHTITDGTFSVLVVGK